MHPPPIDPSHIRIPDGHCLVADVDAVAIPVFHALVMRTTHLVAVSSDDYAVRTEDGRFLAGQRGGWSTDPRYRPDEEGRFHHLQLDHAGEVAAAIEGEACVDWMNPIDYDYEPERHRFRGLSDDRGEFTINLDPELGHVTTAYATGMGADPVIVVRNARVVPLQPHWLELADLSCLPGR